VPKSHTVPVHALSLDLFGTPQDLPYQCGTLLAATPSTICHQKSLTSINGSLPPGLHAHYCDVAVLCASPQLHPFCSYLHSSSESEFSNLMGSFFNFFCGSLGLLKCSVLLVLAMVQVMNIPGSGLPERGLQND
jgi:hypothetical protein